MYNNKGVSFRETVPLMHDIYTYLFVIFATYFSAEQLVQRWGGVARRCLLQDQAVHLRGLGHHGQVGCQCPPQCATQEVKQIWTGSETDGQEVKQMDRK